MRTKLRTRIGNPSITDVPDANLTTHLNDSYREIANKFKFHLVRSRYDFSTVIGTRLYNLPTGSVAILNPSLIKRSQVLGLENRNTTGRKIVQSCTDHRREVVSGAYKMELELIRDLPVRIIEMCRKVSIRNIRNRRIPNPGPQFRSHHAKLHESPHFFFFLPEEKVQGVGAGPTRSSAIPEPLSNRVPAPAPAMGSVATALPCNPRIPTPAPVTGTVASAAPVKASTPAPSPVTGIVASALPDRTKVPAPAPATATAAVALPESESTPAPSPVIGARGALILTTEAFLRNGVHGSKESRAISDSDN